MKEYEKEAEQQLEQTKQILQSEEGFSESQVNQIERNMVYHRSVAEVRRKS